MDFDVSQVVRITLIILAATPRVNFFMPRKKKESKEKERRAQIS
jgi:hypothetical protein